MCRTQPCSRGRGGGAGGSTPLPFRQASMACRSNRGRADPPCSPAAAAAPPPCSARQASKALVNAGSRGGECGGGPPGPPRCAPGGGPSWQRPSAAQPASDNSSNEAAKGVIFCSDPCMECSGFNEERDAALRRAGCRTTGPSAHGCARVVRHRSKTGICGDHAMPRPRPASRVHRCAPERSDQLIL